MLFHPEKKKHESLKGHNIFLIIQMCRVWTLPTRNISQEKTHTHTNTTVTCHNLRLFGKKMTMRKTCFDQTTYPDSFCLFLFICTLSTLLFTPVPSLLHLFFILSCCSKGYPSSLTSAGKNTSAKNSSFS